MFNEEFYPTPIGIVKKMIYPFVEKEYLSFRGYKERVIRNKTILEPSAGSGSMLDGIVKDTIPYRNEDGTFNENHKNDRIKLIDCQIYCIEQEPELVHILQGKDYKVIANDFLSYKGDYVFDLILMNPPFSNGDEHLLHAWETLDHGNIICLLNTETIKNPFSSKRKLIQKLISDYGTVEHLGAVFSKSERPTDVQVSLIRLEKKAKENKFVFDFENIVKEKKFVIDESTINDAPAVRDVIGNMLIQYDKVKQAFIEYMKIAESLDHYGKPLIKKRKYKEDQTNIFDLASKCFCKNETKQMAFNNFCDSMKYNMWSVVFDNLNNISQFDMGKFMTHSVRKNFSEFVDKQSNMDFTKENVWSLINMLFENKYNILERCIIEVFDIFTKYHHENRCYVEGWKTNDKWKVNRKIIIPRAVSYGSYTNAHNLKSYGDNFTLNYHTQSEYTDIDKALNYITGKEVGESLFDSLQIRFRDIGRVKTGDKFENTGESYHFKWKFWKKGTLHIEFKNEWLWQEFNMRACAGKQWLPEAEKKEWEQAKKKKESSNYGVKQHQLLLEEFI